MAMLVRCTNNDLRSVDAASPLGREIGCWFGASSTLLPLENGGLYVVYGLQFKDGWLRYFLADDDYLATGYPLSYVAGFFEVVDRRLSHCWVSQHPSDPEPSLDVVMAFPEWTDDPGFYERLVDGDADAVRIFRRRKEFMDVEYPSPLIDDPAEVVDECWLLCPRCSDAWESTTLVGLVRCPSCSTLLANPRYRALPE